MAVASGAASEADIKRLREFSARPQEIKGADADGERRTRETSPREAYPTGPYHLISTNVILVGSEERTWRLRGGDSFILSPRLCGSNATGWCPTEEFLRGDLTLATAMAISGAAANPYAGGGIFRNRLVAILMSLANLRLGYWVV